MLVDDHHVVRLGLRTLFESVAHVAVVGEASTAAEAIALAGRCRPDVILLDVRLPDASGVEVCRGIRSSRPEIRVIMLTSYDDDEAVFASLMAGAAGYLLKSIDPQRLIEGVEAVARGRSLLDPEVTQSVLTRLRRPASVSQRDPLGELTEQERKILPLIARGKTNRQIAADLHQTSI
jgi:two-component system response regulator DevR